MIWGGIFEGSITLYLDFFFNCLLLDLGFFEDLSFTCFAKLTAAALCATVEIRAPVQMGHGIL
tara:strand:+ start:1476 stop:1664 length:189 start_codon:yes stop_codon:yes gene_type:complete